MRLFHTTRSAIANRGIVRRDHANRDNAKHDNMNYDKMQTDPTTAQIGSNDPVDWSALGDRRLCGLLNAGTPSEQSHSFSALYDRYELMIRNYVLKQLNYREEDSIEAIGDTWLTFWQERENFVWRDDAQTENPLQSWLYGIARNRVKAKVRQIEKEQQKVAAVPLELVSKFIEGRLADESAESPYTELPSEANQQVNRLMRELKPTEQQIITLRYYKGLTYKEISQQLGKSSAAVRTAHTRLIQKLRQVAESEAQGARSSKSI